MKVTYLLKIELEMPRDAYVDMDEHTLCTDDDSARKQVIETENAAIEDFGVPDYILSLDADMTLVSVTVDLDE